MMKSILPEYQSACNRIVIRSDVMGHSKTHVAVEKITAYIKANKGIVGGNISDVIKSAIVKAFENSELKNYYPIENMRRDSYITIPELDYSGEIWNDVILLCCEFTWEREIIHAALVILVGCNDSRLQSFLGLLGRARHECTARKRFVFSIIVSAAGEILKSTSTHDLMDETLSLEKAIEKVKEHGTNFIEDYKDKALWSSFLEPCIMLFTYNCNDTAAGDVDVHGANTFIALLDATIGVKTSRMALMEDGVHGLCEFRRTEGFDEDLARIQSPSNIGKRFTYDRRRLMRRSHVQDGHFIFRGRTVQDIARKASSSHLSSSAERAEYAKYLDVFSSYFTPDIILERLFNSINQDEETCNSLKLVFSHLKSVDLLSTDMNPHQIPESCGSIYEYIYTDEDIPHFIPGNAQRLFSECGLANPVDITIGLVSQRQAISRTSLESSPSKATERPRKDSISNRFSHFLSRR